MLKVRMLAVAALSLAATSSQISLASAPLTGAIAIATGSLQSCALVAGNGVKCWGNGSSGQLGNGVIANVPAPVDVTGLTEGVIQVTGGDFHTCALTNGGAVKCWGSNFTGQLGNGTTTQALSPVAVTGLQSGVAAIAAGERHACALTVGGGVKCWGGNASGQLGNGTTTLSLTAVDVTGLTTGVAAIATGGSHTCALTVGGGVKCWGWNRYGQLGNGTMTDSLTAVDVTGLTSGVAAISSRGDNHSCALTGAGGVKCWGFNLFGQLGNGTTTNALTAVDVTSLTAGVAAIAVGSTHTCALTSVGAKCWGNNSSGQLGNGTTARALTAVDVMGLAGGVVAIAAGGPHSCALMSGGGVKCWGNGLNGEVGNGLFGTFTTPQVVILTACANFADVDPASVFCPRVEWLKNRAVTLGCTSATLYCPDNSVTRLAMAAFMNRLGTSLTMVPATMQQAVGALNPDASPVICVTADFPTSGFPRQAYLDGVLTGIAPGDVGLAVDLVSSSNLGASWQTVVANVNRGSLIAGRWGNIHVVGHSNTSIGFGHRYGMRVTRGGLPGTATLSDSNCNLRVRIDNRNGALQPF